MSRLLMFHDTHGPEDPERATIPFVAASVAAASGERAVVVCTADAVWLGTPGGADGVQAPGQPPLVELVEGFVAAGGELWLCSSCTHPRGITEDGLAPGAVIVGAARLVEELAGGAQSVTLT